METNKYYDQAVKFMEDKDQYNRDRRAHLIKPIKDITQKLGVKGTVGGIAGLVIGGPLMAVAGALAAKNSKAVYGFAKDRVGEVINGVKITAEAIGNANELEKIDPDAKYQSTPNDKWYNFIENGLGFMKNKTRNAGTYKILGRMAEEEMKKTGEYTNQEETFKKFNKDREKAIKQKSFDQIRTEILKLRNKIMGNPQGFSKEDLKKYNGFIETQDELGAELGIKESGQYFERLYVRNNEDFNPNDSDNSYQTNSNYKDPTNPNEDAYDAEYTENTKNTIFELN